MAFDSHQKLSLRDVVVDGVGRKGVYFYTIWEEMQFVYTIGQLSETSHEKAGNAEERDSH